MKGIAIRVKRGGFAVAGSVLWTVCAAGANFDEGCARLEGIGADPFQPAR